MRLVSTASTLICVAFAGSALGQTFKDSLVQAPSIARPERGSIAGSLSRLSFGPAELSRGTFSLPSAIALPTERGAPLVDLTPTYSPENGLSEWGMGFGLNLSITRMRILGDIDYANDQLVGPWGRMELDQNGDLVPVGWAEAVRMSPVADHVREQLGISSTGGWAEAVRMSPVAGGFVAVTDQGTRFTFATSDAITNPSGTYRWMLSEVESALGERTRLTYVKNSSGRAFLTRAEYGGRSGVPQYRVDFTYEPIAQPFVDYRSGHALVLDRRVVRVVVSAYVVASGDYQARWIYDLDYRESPTGPAFYLASIVKSYASGEAEPPVTYEWVLAEEQLAAASLEPIPELDAYLTENGGDAIQPDRVSMLDGDRDGRIELERPYDHALLRQTENGWVEEPLPPFDGTENPLCRPPPSSSNAPRLLARMRPGGNEPHVVVTRPNGATTSLLICDRAGHQLHLEVLPGQWHLGPNTRLVDLNRDLRPDIIRVYRGGYEVLENTSTENAFSFVRRAARPIAPLFTPSSTWVSDMNGDGIADVVSRFPSGLVVWHGLGRFELQTQGQLFTFVTSANQQLTNLDLFQLTFTDVDMNGLMDVLLSRSSSLHLFTNRGNHFRQAAVPGFAAIGWAFGYPVAADLEGHGEEQAVVVQGTRAYELTLTAPEAGLLLAADDGKGTRIEFAYERAPATPGIDRRPSLLSSITLYTSGYDVVTHRYDYDDPFFHSDAQFLVGFGLVRKDTPNAIEEVVLHNDDDVGGIVIGTALLDPRVPGLAQVTDRTLEEANLFGVRLLRPVSERSGWTGSLGSITAKTIEYLEYERGRCVTRTRTTSRHGTLVRALVLADVVDLDPDLHCLHQQERVEGTHPGRPDLDFVHVLELGRNEIGQVTSVTSMGDGDDPLLLQTVTYDAQHRVESVTHPGRGTTSVAYDPITGRTLEAVSPEGVVTRVVEADALSDAVLTFETVRGQRVWRESFRYDGLERLARRWDNLSGATEAEPIALFTYRYATAESPGSIRVRTAIDPSQQIAREQVDLLAADGEQLATASRIPEGWAISGLAQTSRVRGVKETWWRAPLAEDPEDATLAELFGGASTLLVTSAFTAFGQPLDETALVQAGVVRNAANVLTIENGLLARTLVENGETRSTVLEDGAGAIVEVRDALGHSTTYRYDALGRIVEVVLPPSADCGGEG